MTIEQRRNALAWLRKKRKEARQMASFLTKFDNPKLLRDSVRHAGRADAFFQIQRYLAERN